MSRCSFVRRTLAPSGAPGSRAEGQGVRACVYTHAHVLLWMSVSSRPPTDGSGCIAFLDLPFSLGLMGCVAESGIGWAWGICLSRKLPARNRVNMSKYVAFDTDAESES